VLQDVFEGNTIESLLVNPVQRIPRYPLLLRDLQKYTSEKHWDYDKLTAALEGIGKLNKEIDQRTREQADFKLLRKLQERFGQGYTVVSTGRHLVSSLENVKLSSGLVISLYLFNDYLLLHQPSVAPPDQFVDLQMVRTKMVLANGTLTISEKARYQIQAAEGLANFQALFHTTRREYLQRMCTFDGALRWTVVPHSGPPPLRSPAMASIGRDLYLFGGRADDLSITNNLWYYGQGIWRLLATVDPPPPRFACSLNVYDEKLIVFGGQNATESFNDLWEFDIPTLTWERLQFPNPPPPRNAHATAFTTTQLWLFGGKCEETYMNDFYCCDLFERVWYHIETPTVPEPRAWHTAFWVMNDQRQFFAIFGGASRSSANGTIWLFDYDNCDWFAPQVKGDLPGPRFAHTTAVLDRHLYIIGGRNMTNTTVDPIRVNMAQMPFEAVVLPQTDEPDPFQFGACAVWENSGFALFGGPKEAPHRGLWEIRLRAELDAGVPAAPKEESGEPSVLSRPIYTEAAGAVTATVGDPRATFAVDRVFNTELIGEIARQVNGVWRWRQAAVVSATQESETDSAMLLPEATFAPPPSLALPLPPGGKAGRHRATTRMERPKMGSAGRVSPPTLPDLLQQRKNGGETGLPLQRAWQLSDDGPSSVQFEAVLPPPPLGQEHSLPTPASWDNLARLEEVLPPPTAEERKVPPPR
jgi:hypothetical protein